MCKRNVNHHHSWKFGIKIFSGVQSVVLASMCFLAEKKRITTKDKKKAIYLYRLFELKGYCINCVSLERKCFKSPEYIQKSI